MKKAAQLILIFVPLLFFSFANVPSPHPSPLWGEGESLPPKYLSGGEGTEGSIITAQAVSEDVENRLAEISKKKEEMRLELEEMIKEEEKLREDIEKEGRLMPIRKKRDLERRSKELADKINRFNEELDKLVQEEQSLQKPM